MVIPRNLLLLSPALLAVLFGIHLIVYLIALIFMHGV